MVKTRKVGKKRPFYRGLLLTVVTFGIYGIYWSYKAPKELYDQFELLQEGRDDGVVWLVLGLVVPVVMFVYYWKAVDNVAYLRRRLGFDDALTPKGFLAYVIGGTVATMIGLLGMAGGLAIGAEIALTLVLGLGTILAGLAVQAYGYYRLQTDINELWDDWRARVDELTGTQAGTASPSPSPAETRPPDP